MSEATTNQEFFYGVGRRKRSVARVRLYPGDGQIVVNGKPATEYFGGRGALQYTITEPLRMTGLNERFNVVVNVVGGGSMGQSGAVRHGISRALLRFDEELRPTLKQGGLLTRDSREKERKKPGLKRARKAPQYTKR